MKAFAVFLPAFVRQILFTWQAPRKQNQPDLQAARCSTLKVRTSCEVLQLYFLGHASRALAVSLSVLLVKSKVKVQTVCPSSAR